ncbi:sugar transferase [bacterium]|nr:sugar transferase [bacterium]
MYRRHGKRLLDIVLAGGALLVLSPVILLIYLAIRLEDSGPALFRQQRVGQFGNLFTVLKFRSMPVNTANVPSAQAKTLTVTRTGAFIRRTNLDELPQLLNILRGDMSLVGPRPALNSQRDLCARREALGVFLCKPGLTGLAQIHAYDNMPDAEKVQWDAQYCANLSLKIDIEIVLRTFGYLLKPPPTY